MKKCIIFDLDGTLTASKSPLEPAMAGLMHRLLERTMVAVISGGSFAQFQKQFLPFIHDSELVLSHLFIFPTSGSSFYKHEVGRWVSVYEEHLTGDEKRRIIAAFDKAIPESGVEMPKRVFGVQLEDRGSQMTFSINGQDAPLSVKQTFDRDKMKRQQIKKILDMLLTDLEVRIGGTNSIDVTKKGIDKEYGIRQIEKHLRIPIKHMVFVGDAIFPGGNDFAATKTGIETVQVKDENETKKLIERWLQE